MPHTFRLSFWFWLWFYLWFWFWLWFWLWFCLRLWLRCRLRGHLYFFYYLLFYSYTACSQRRGEEGDGGEGRAATGLAEAGEMGKGRHRVIRVSSGET